MATKLSKRAQAERDKAREDLLAIIQKASKDRHGATVVRTILRHVSTSGMSRDISLFVVDAEDGSLWNITHLTNIALEDKPKERNGQNVVRVGGCGMDMGFHLVDCLGYALGKQSNGLNLKQEWV